jgi:hypothetical protein
VQAGGSTSQLGKDATPTLPRINRSRPDRKFVRRFAGWTFRPVDSGDARIVAERLPPGENSSPQETRALDITFEQNAEIA